MNCKRVFFLSVILLISTAKVFSQGIANYDPEIDKNNLMLVDATLELNEAMLAGIKASLDTLDKPEPAINSNDVKEILQRMKRAKDREQLKPYLEFMNDSLSLDCNKLRLQKEDILSRLNPYYEHLRKDSIEAERQKHPELTQTTTASAKNTKTSKKNTEKKPVAETAVAKKDTLIRKQETITTSTKEKEAIKPKGIDTIIVYDLEKVKPIKPADEKKQVKLEPAKPVSKHDSIANRIRTDIMEGSAKKDTAKLTTTKVITQKKDTVVVTKIIPSNKDSIVVTKGNISKKDTTNHQKVATVKPLDTKATTAGAGYVVDTTQIIKSQFFLKRAQKAIYEKKQKLAEEYLSKSIELWRDNFDTWMTLADQDALHGSTGKALTEYQECLRIDSSNARLAYKIGSLHLQSKKKTEAMQYFTKAVKLDTSYILAYIDRASIYSDWKQYNEAIKDYDKVLQMNIKYHFAYKARGMVKQLTGKFSEAVDDFTRYLIFEESDPSAYYYRGLAKIGNNELLEGCIDLSKSAEMGYSAAEKAIKKSCE